LVGLQEEKDYFEETGVDRQTMLKWIFKKQYEGNGLDSSGSEYGYVTGFCEHGSEPPVPIKYGEFFEEPKIS
jgi:hypothetical protein